MKHVLIILCFLVSVSVFANAKKREQFIASIVKECGKTEAEAKSMISPGRSGNLTKFMLCTSPTVDVDSSCTVNCTRDDGNVVGQ